MRRNGKKSLKTTEADYQSIEGTRSTNSSTRDTSFDTWLDQQKASLEQQLGYFEQTFNSEKANQQSIHQDDVSDSEVARQNEISAANTLYQNAQQQGAVELKALQDKYWREGEDGPEGIIAQENFLTGAKVYTLKLAEKTVNYSRSLGEAEVDHATRSAESAVEADRETAIARYDADIDTATAIKDTANAVAAEQALYDKAQAGYTADANRALAPKWEKFNVDAARDWRDSRYTEAGASETMIREIADALRSSTYTVAAVAESCANAEADDWRTFYNAAADASEDFERAAAQADLLFVSDLGTIGVQYTADVNAAFLAVQTVIHGAYSMYVFAVGQAIVNWHQYVETARVNAILDFYGSDPEIAGIMAVAVANADYNIGLAQLTAATLNSLESESQTYDTTVTNARNSHDTQVAMYEQSHGNAMAAALVTWTNSATDADLLLAQDQADAHVARVADTAPADRAFAEAEADADRDYEHKRGTAERQKQNDEATADFEREEDFWPEHTILETAKANAEETRADSKADAQKTLATQQALAAFAYAQIEAQVARDKVQPIAQKEVQVDLKKVSLTAAQENLSAQQTYVGVSAEPLSAYAGILAAGANTSWVTWAGHTLVGAVAGGGLGALGGCLLGGAIGAVGGFILGNVPGAALGAIGGCKLGIVVGGTVGTLVGGVAGSNSDSYLEAAVNGAYYGGRAGTIAGGLASLIWVFAGAPAIPALGIAGANSAAIAEAAAAANLAAAAEAAAAEGAATVLAEKYIELAARAMVKAAEAAARGDMNTAKLLGRQGDDLFRLAQSILRSIGG